MFFSSNNGNRNLVVLMQWFKTGKPWKLTNESTQLLLMSSKEYDIFVEGFSKEAFEIDS